MVEVEVMPSAVRDIKNIIEYVFTQSVQNSENLYHEFIDKINSLSHFPERGSVVGEVTMEQLREIKLYHYRIIYRCISNKVQVLTVHHSSRLLMNNPHLKDLL